MDHNLQDIRSILSLWYSAHKRELPWRETTNPYHIWISEIILQQTRVAQGYDYYTRFVNRFPTIEDLAEAEQDEVLKLWQGLGYYSRARNLHAAAKMVIDKFDGKFPDSHKEILSLKGIGDYTAAAIASFAYNLPFAAVDGNVYRVISRLFGIDTPIDTTTGKKEFAKLAQDLLDVSDPGTHNQAMIEYGALQCTPSNPDCGKCPLASYCVAYKTDGVQLFPVKQGKTKVRQRYFYYIDVRCADKMLFHKRGEGDIWQGLYELPLIEVDQKIEMEQLLVHPQYQYLIKGQDVSQIRFVANFKHILSHQIINAYFCQINVDSIHYLTQHYTVAAVDDLDTFPVSRLVELYLEKL